MCVIKPQEYRMCLLGRSTGIDIEGKERQCAMCHQGTIEREMKEPAHYLHQNVCGSRSEGAGAMQRSPPV